jgi:hypothetical protein
VTTCSNYQTSRVLDAWGLLPSAMGAMIAGMNKLILIGILGIDSVIGCASQQQTPEPQTGPPGVDIEYQDREDSATSKPIEREPAPADAKPPKADETGGAQDEPTSKSAPAAKSCAGLKKSDCEVRMGCAWSTDKVCVNQ